MESTTQSVHTINKLWFLSEDLNFAKQYLHIDFLQGRGTLSYCVSSVELDQTNRFYASANVVQG